MSGKTKYQFVLSGVMLLFVYLTATEVTDRWRETWDRYLELRRKQEEILDPQKLIERKHELTVRRNSLASFLTNDKGEVEQSQTGVFGFLTDKARQTKTRIESLVPLKAQSEGRIENIGFRVGLSSSFHELGSYLNALETGTMSITIKKLELANQMKSSLLHAEIEGVAYIFPRKSQQ